MTIQELKGDLNRLQDDAVRVARDSQSLIKDFGEQIEIVEDEFVAAEFLATNSTFEGFGALYDSAIRLRKIGRKQIKYCIDDGRLTIKGMRAADTSEEYIDTFLSHVGRRVDHIAFGIESIGRLVGKELDEFSGSVDTSWNLFSRLVNADWSTAAKENH